VLDGIVVEAGELDDASWSELKREKERRNRHLQLIRKFNRHGHIIVSSTSHLEANEIEERRNTESAPSIPSNTKPSSEIKYPGTVKTEFGSDTTMTMVHVATEGEQFETEKPASSSMDVDRLAILHGDQSSSITQSTNWQANQVTTFRYPRVPEFSPPSPPSEPSPGTIAQIMSDLTSWITKSSATRVRRPTQPVGDDVSLSRPSNSSGMDIDFGEVGKMLEKVDQWKRHFWNLMERASTLQKREGDPFSFVGAEKLPAIVRKLEEFVDLMKEMRDFLVQTQSSSEQAKQFLVKISRQQESVGKCLVVYQQIQP